MSIAIAILAVGILIVLGAVAAWCAVGIAFFIIWLGSWNRVPPKSQPIDSEADVGEAEEADLDPSYWGL